MRKYIRRLRDIPSFLGKRARELRHSAFVIGLLSLIWLLLRTGTKPSRIVYPCQRAAAKNSYLWLSIYLIPLLHKLVQKLSRKINSKKLLPLFFAVILVVGAVLWNMYEQQRRRMEIREVGLKITGKLAKFEPSSSIFVVNGTKGK